jgi:LmbE family N-acetylglucosaminyl deacetylase
MGKIAVVAAHPDDETLGMGAAIRQFTDLGHQVSVLFLSSGVGARNLERELESSRMSAARKALAILGVSDIQFSSFPDNQFDTVPMLEVVKVIELFLDEKQIMTVFTNNRYDLNVDHRITAEAALVACRPTPRSRIRNLVHFETLSSSEWNFGSQKFNQNLYIGASAGFGKKLLALQEYVAELEDFPHPRSLDAISALGTLRGSECGLPIAEAFQVAFMRN